MCSLAQSYGSVVVEVGLVISFVDHSQFGLVHIWWEGQVQEGVVGEFEYL